MVLFEFQSMRTNSLPPFGCETSPRNVGGANMSEIHCCMLANDGKLQKEARSSLLANTHHISVSRVWKNYSCETVISGSLVLLQVASLVAVDSHVLINRWLYQTKIAAYGLAS